MKMKWWRKPAASPEPTRTLVELVGGPAVEATLTRDLGCVWIAFKAVDGRAVVEWRIPVSVFRDAFKGKVAVTADEDVTAVAAGRDFFLTLRGEPYADGRPYHALLRLPSEAVWSVAAGQDEEVVQSRVG